MPTLLPIFLDLAEQSVLLVGGGAAAREKLEKLVTTGARIAIVARTVGPEVRALIAQHGIAYEERAFQTSDVDGRFLVISAVDDVATHSEIAQAARARGILVNTVDAPRECDFYFGAQVQRGPLQLAISTQGLFPGVARALRIWLEDAFPPKITAEFEQLALLRRQIQTRIPDPQERMKALRQQLQFWMKQTENLDRGVSS